MQRQLALRLLQDGVAAGASCAAAGCAPAAARSPAWSRSTKPDRLPRSMTPLTGGGGRSQGKMLIVGAVERADRRWTRPHRLAEVSASANSLHPFVTKHLAPGGYRQDRRMVRLIPALPERRPRSPSHRQDGRPYRAAVRCERIFSNLKICRFGASIRCHPSPASPILPSTSRVIGVFNRRCSPALRPSSSLLGIAAGHPHLHLPNVHLTGSQSDSSCRANTRF